LRKTGFSRYTPYAFMFPALLLVTMILLYPVILGVISSFKNIILTAPVPEKFVGFANYWQLFNDSMFKTALSKSLVWTFSIVLAELVFGYMIALLLNQDLKWKKLFRSMILIPWVIPSAIVAVIWKWIFAEQYGLLNGMLYKLGLISNYQGWLSDNVLAFWCLVVTSIWKGTPFVAIVILAGLQSIDRTIYEAADVDGVGIFGKFWKITLPMMKNITLTVGTLSAIWTFNSFDIIQIITRGGPGDSTLTMPMMTYKLFNHAFQVSYASAVATIMMIALVIPSYFYVRSVLKD
jgi:multiple sugar transport system permease protein